MNYWLAVYLSLMNYGVISDSFVCDAIQNFFGIDYSNVAYDQLAN
jgi:hypothetical protein